MFKWNIRNQILSAGMISFVLLTIIVIVFYNFSGNQFREDSKNLISVANQQYADKISKSLGDRNGTFAKWTQDDIFGLAIEFQTTRELDATLEEWISNSPDFYLIGIINDRGVIVDAKTNPHLNLNPSGLIGQQLPDFSQIKRLNEKSAYFIKSRVLESMDIKDNNTYLFYAPAFASTGDRNGGFIAYMNWHEANDQINDCLGIYRDLSFDNARTFIAYPGLELIPLHSNQQDLALNGSEIRDLWHYSRTNNNITINIATLEKREMLIGINNIIPPELSISESGMANVPYLYTIVEESDVMAGLNRQLALIIIFAGLGTLLVVAMSYYISIRISRRIKELANIATEMAQGNVEQNIEIQSRDEIGILGGAFSELFAYIKSMADAAVKISQNDLAFKIQPKSDKDVLGNAFHRMLENLTDVVRQLRMNTEEFLMAANNITQSSEEIAAGAKNQSEQANQVAAAVEEMSSAIMQSSKNANDAKHEAEQSSEISNKGQEIVGQTINSLIKITNAATQSNEIVHELAKASGRISEITGVINDIADQTNLLALNAAIEAARAGEQGRGFAVVADEVRKLAERTGKATGEINEMIKGIQVDSERAVASMEEAGKLVEDGKEKADQAGISLNEINQMSQRVRDVIVQIATAADQQSAAAEEISKNVGQISEVTREAASSAGQSASAAEQLNRQAEILQKMIGRYKVYDQTES